MAVTPQHLVVMGVSGSGKTTVASCLSEHLGWIAAEADEFHSAANIAKMTSGFPLDDDDRQPWLAAIREWMSIQARHGRSTIVTCSALKRRYRDELRQAVGDVHFVHLSGEPGVLRERMKTRSGHFMPPALLASQLATLEPLEAGEPGITVDIMLTPSEIAQDILQRLKLPQNR